MHFDVSMGIYVYDERALAHLPAGPCQFPELVVRLLDAGERVAAYRSGGGVVRHRDGGRVRARVAGRAGAPGALRPAARRASGRSRDSGESGARQ